MFFGEFLVHMYMYIHSYQIHRSKVNNDNMGLLKEGGGDLMNFHPAKKKTKKKKGKSKKY